MPTFTKVRGSGESVTIFSKEEVASMLAVDEASSELADQISAALKEQKRLLSLIGDLERLQDDEQDLMEILQRNEQLKSELAMLQPNETTEENPMTKSIDALELVTKVSANIQKDHQDLAKRCQDVLDLRLGELRKDHPDLSNSALNAKLTADPIAQKAYAELTKSQDAAAAAMRNADSLAG